MTMQSRLRTVLRPSTPALVASTTTSATGRSTTARWLTSLRTSERLRTQFPLDSESDLRSVVGWIAPEMLKRYTSSVIDDKALEMHEQLAQQGMKRKVLPWPSRHDRSRENDAFVNAGGRPSQINAA